MIDLDFFISKQDQPRYEFRSFGQDFGEVIVRMKTLSEPVPELMQERWSDEIYILSPFNDRYNVKIRYGKIDIKELAGVSETFEKWSVFGRFDFPVSQVILAGTVLPLFSVELPDLEKESYLLDEFLHLAGIHPDLLKVRSKKQRFGYFVNNCICEFANVWVNGAKVLTICCESDDIAGLKNTITDLKMEGFENINYIQALKRITGMVDKTLANE